MKKTLAILYLYIAFLVGCSSSTPITTTAPSAIETPPASVIASPTITRTVIPTIESVELTGCVTVNNLRVRSRPGSEGEILDRIQNGECVSIVGRTEDANWIAVSYDGSSGWVSSTYIDIIGNIDQLPIIHDSSLTLVQSDIRVKDLSDFLLDTINDPSYDESKHLFHKYLGSLSIYIDNQTLTYMVFDKVESIDDFLLISSDLVSLGAMVSNPGKENDWMLQRIEVILFDTTSEESAYENKVYVIGADNISAIANQQVNAIDLMEIETRAYLNATQTPTIVPTQTNTAIPTPVVKRTIYSLCEEAWNKIGDYISCEIPKAYCTYQLIEDQTFCWDGPNSNYNFTFVTSEYDLGDLDGQCIVVTGKVVLEDDKPHINAQNKEQVFICP